MKFYAYKPDVNGKEPMGTDRRILFELKTRKGAIRRTRRMFGDNVRLFSYTNFYDDRTFSEVFF